MQAAALIGRDHQRNSAAIPSSLLRAPCRPQMLEAGRPQACWATAWRQPYLANCHRRQARGAPTHCRYPAVHHAGPYNGFECTACINAGTVNEQCGAPQACGTVRPRHLLFAISACSAILGSTECFLNGLESLATYT